MISYDEALKTAINKLGKVDFCEEFESYFVFSYEQEVETDDSRNVFAISKTNGQGYIFVAVITDLGKRLHTYKIDANGHSVEVLQEEDDED